MTIRYTVVGFVILLACLGARHSSAASYYGSGWYRQLQLSIATDNNASRTQYPASRLSDSVSAARFGLGYTQMIGDAGKLILGGYLGYSNHGKISGLSNTAATLKARYIFQVRPGFDYPWYDTAISLTRLDFHGGNRRDGYLLDGTISINKRLRGDLTAHAGYRYHDMLFPEKSAAEKSQDSAFDISRHEAFVGMDCRIVANVFGFFEYSYQQGSFTTSSRGALLPAYYGYTGSTLDTAIADAGWWAYRYDGHMQTLYFGVNFTVGDIDFEISARNWHTRSNTGRSYPDQYLQIGANWSF